MRPLLQSVGTVSLTLISQKRSWSTSTVVVMSALSSSTVKQSTPGALPAFMLMMALLISALVMGPDGISSITSMSLITSASLSGLGLFSNSTKYSFHLCCTSSFFVNKLPSLLLTMSIFFGSSLHSLLAASYTSFICPHLAASSASCAILLAHSLLSFLKLFFTSRSFFLYSCCSFASLIAPTLFQLTFALTVSFLQFNPHVTPGLGIEPGPQRWEASALTTAPSLREGSILQRNHAYSENSNVQPLNICN